MKIAAEGPYSFRKAFPYVLILMGSTFFIVFVRMIFSPLLEIVRADMKMRHSEAAVIFLITTCHFHVEPVVCLGSTELEPGDDGYCLRTVDGRPAALFEHTISVTFEGVECLTR